MATGMWKLQENELGIHSLVVEKTVVYARKCTEPNDDGDLRGSNLR